jgi:carbamoylphosphate synthase large subunit
MRASREFCDRFVNVMQVGYPVLVRPSYVLSGAAMNVVRSESELQVRACVLRLRIHVPPSERPMNCYAC